MNQPKVSRVEDVEKKEQTKHVRSVKKPSVPPAVQAELDKANKLDFSKAEKSENVQQIRSMLHSEHVEQEKDKLMYSIPYETLCGDKVSGVPSKLHYQPINGYYVTLLNELNLTNIDHGINSVLDSLCYESKYKGFSHWEMPRPEKIRSFFNLRINSDGPVIETASGICSKCGQMNVVVKMNLIKLEEDGLKDSYKEPFPLKAKIKGEEKKIGAKIIRSGDIYKAEQIYKNDTTFISKFFPGDHDEVQKNSIIQILEYASSILTIDGYQTSYEESVEMCRDNLDVIKALTSFNDYFMYGLKLEQNTTCKNKECPSNNIPSMTKGEEGDEKLPRGCLHSVPLQPALFYIYTEQEQATKYFDDGFEGV